MRLSIVLFLSIVLAAPAQAGLVGWLTSETRDWEFVESSGGIRVSTPIEIDGKRYLPVEYWPEGHSGIEVRKISLVRKGLMLAIRITTQLASKDSTEKKTHLVELSGISPGTYRLYYGKIHKPQKFLGLIEVKKQHTPTIKYTLKNRADLQCQLEISHCPVFR